MKYVLIGTVWLIFAIVAGATGRVAALRPPAPQLVLLALTAALGIAIAAGAEFRAWLVRLGWRPIVALHLARFVGLYFIFLWTRGDFPFEFAVPGGIGDSFVALLAAVLLLTGGHGPAPRWLVIWNWIGLADILFVVATAARLGMAAPESMAALLRLPLSLLPTFLVPLIIASHLWFLTRRQGAR